MGKLVVPLKRVMQILHLFRLGLADQEELSFPAEPENGFAGPRDSYPPGPRRAFCCAGSSRQRRLHCKSDMKRHSL